SSGVADVTFSRGCTAGVGSFAVVVTSGDLGDVAAIAAVAAVAALTAGRAGAAGAASTTVSESGCARHGGEAQGAHGHDNRFPDRSEERRAGKYGTSAGPRNAVEM